MSLFACLDYSEHERRQMLDVIGFAGAMFLNMCVKYIPNRDDLTDHLRAVLPAPETVHSGREKMGRLQQFVEDLISTGEVLKSQFQPARIPFFVGAWWHLQDTERWPRCSTSRRARRWRWRDYIVSPVQKCPPLLMYWRFSEREGTSRG